MRRDRRRVMDETLIGERMTGTADTATAWVIGASGQLGRALIERSPSVGRGDDSQLGRALIERAPTSTELTVRGLTSADIDITDSASVAAALAGLATGDVVLNCAAHTDVDGAESDPEAASAVNVDGPRHLATATAEHGAWLIHLSTDYVYAGPAAIDVAEGLVCDIRRTPYEPSEAPGAQQPPTVYGRTKLAGELAAQTADPRSTIVRTAGVFTGGPQGGDFVATMRKLERSHDQITVVDDQTVSPTYVRDLADGLWQLVVQGPGSAQAGQTLHSTNAGAVTWFEVARAVFAEVGADPERVQPCTTAQYPRPAPRPAYSVLADTSWRAAGLTPLRDWRAAVAAAITHV